MLLRDVTGLDGGIGENCFAILANIFPGFTTDNLLNIRRGWRAAERTEHSSYAPSEK